MSLKDWLTSPEVGDARGIPVPPHIKRIFDEALGLRTPKTSSWKLRYATSKVPSKCLFCHGPSHYFKVAREIINDENSGKFVPETEGLPRKFWTETSSNFMHMKPMPKYAPVPYIQDPLANPDLQSAYKAVSEHRCVFCGVPFKKDETVSRFNYSSPQVNSLQTAEYYPMHTKCLSITRKFCPGLYMHPDEHFETGTYEQLRANAEKQVGSIEDPGPRRPVEDEEYSGNFDSISSELINKLFGK